MALSDFLMGVEELMDYTAKAIQVLQHLADTPVPETEEILHVDVRDYLKTEHLKVYRARYAALERLGQRLDPEFIAPEMLDDAEHQRDADAFEQQLANGFDDLLEQLRGEESIDPFDFI